MNGREKKLMPAIQRIAGVLITILSSFPGAQAENESLRIGVILPLSGPFARYGSKIEKAISEFANKKVSFVFEDEGCDPQKAVNSFKKLSELHGGIHLFLGPWCGSPQRAVAPLLKSSNSLALLGSSATEALFEISGRRMFSTQPSIESESTFLAQKSNEFGIKTVMIIFRENQFSREHEAAFRAHFRGEIFETRAYVSDDISELKSIALRVRQQNPDALYVPDAFPLMRGLLKELRGVGVVSKKVFSVYSAQSEDVLSAVGEEGEGLIYSYPAIGEDDALHYFPRLAAEMLTEAASRCDADIPCVKEKLIDTQKFDAHGVFAGKLILKTIRDGRFQPLN